MFKNANFFLSILSFLICSCTIKPANGDISNPPTKSFVKILHTIDIKSCTNPKDKNCPIGIRNSVGSGMAVKVLNGKMTVLTAGHVCDVGPTKAIKDFVQTVLVIDYQSNIHQAWPIHISQGNGIGSIDACLLYVPTLEVVQVNISKKEPLIGQDIYYIGAPMGIYHPPTVPIFKGVYSGVVNPSSAMITAPAIGGSSGSSVFNYKNEVVGVVWGSNIHFNQVTLMTNYKSFKVFLDTARKNMIKNLKHQ